MPTPDSNQPPAHTPPPWRHPDCNGYIYDVQGRCVATSYHSIHVPVEERKANAEFIVRAVNQHAALVAALENEAKEADEEAAYWFKCGNRARRYEAQKRAKRIRSTLAAKQGGAQ